MAENVINEPFAVINSDDFYGNESYALLADFLKSVEGKCGKYCMIAYHLANTLSESGSVNRGVCGVDGEGLLASVTERTNIAEIDGQISFPDADGNRQPIEADALVSMNMWGFTPDYFEHSAQMFADFLRQHGMEPKSEFYIPTVVDTLITNKLATCEVIDTPSKWFGVTYAEDRAQVVEKINRLIEQGIYPQQLWQ